MVAPAPGPAAFYEAYQGWAPSVARSIALHLHEGLSPGPLRAAFLGCATGMNDALPFARLSGPADHVLASDIDTDLLDTLRSRARAERVANLEVRRADITRDLPSLGTFDMVALFFVIHRLVDWRPVVPALAGMVRPAGAFYTSEFAGPGGLIYLSNEHGGDAQDPVARLIRRTFELLPGRFAPPLKSTFVRPFLEALAGFFDAEGHRDFAWPQSLTVGEMHARIEARAYAPWVAMKPTTEVLDQLRSEFRSEWAVRCDLTETIRIYRFRRRGA